MRILKVSIMAVAVLIVATPAFGLYIDGDLSDWGVVVADNNLSTFQFSPGIGLLGSHLEDQNDKAGESIFIGPNYGGQNYDAEMMAVALQGNMLYIALVTGQRPDNGFASFGPGDLRIETDGMTYGIEIGGGAGGTTGGGSIFEGAPGSTYTLQNQGRTTGHATANAAQTVGSIWSDVTWINDPIAPYGPVQFQINPNSTLFGHSDYIYTLNSVTAQHAIIELALNASIVGPSGIASFHWRPSCGNDELDVFTTLSIPEPMTLGMFAAGTLLIACRRIRR